VRHCPKPLPRIPGRFPLSQWPVTAHDATVEDLTRRAEYERVTVRANCQSSFTESASESGFGRVTAHDATVLGGLKHKRVTVPLQSMDLQCPQT